MDPIALLIAVAVSLGVGFGAGFYVAGRVAAGVVDDALRRGTLVAPGRSADPAP